MKDLYERVREEVGAVVVGQDEALAQLLGALACTGHVLIEGPPGVAKTLLARSVARALGLEFARVQFTPDMLPSDLTGTMVLRGGELEFRPGPCSPTSCSPTRSTAPRRRPRRRCSRRCRRARCRSTATRTRCPTRFW